MSNSTSLHQRKVHSMGTLLAVISWLGIAGCSLVLAGIVFLAATNNFSFIQNGGFLGDEPLPQGINKETTVGELLEADRAFLQSHSTSFLAHTAIAVAFYLLVGIIFLRVAYAWRRGEPFSRATIMGLRWLGALLLGQVVLGFLYYAVAPAPSLLWTVERSLVYDKILEMCTGGHGSNLESGILFLTLSWVLEHGRKLKEEQDLTV